jgi:hypothetical protein
LYIVIEAKGGGSPLGTRRVNEGRGTASQGTSEYFDEISELMSTNKQSRKTQEIGDDLADARARGDIQYLEVRTRIDNDNQGNSVIGNVTAKEFDISSP